MNNEGLTKEELVKELKELQLAHNSLKALYKTDNAEHKHAEQELIIANKEKGKRAAELIVADKELVFQNNEKEKRATELVIANIELDFQNEEKGKRSAELVIANIELAFQKEEKVKRAAELIISNIKFASQSELKEKLEAELIIANLALALQADLIIAKEKAEESEKNLKTVNEEYEAINEELRQTNDDLSIAKDKAEESDRLKSAFLANMSHEIRTPMNGILGFTDLLKTPNLSSEKQQEFILIIENSGKRLLNIINDIINISKIESGIIEINISQSNANEQTDYIYSFFKIEIENKGIQLILNNGLNPINAQFKTDREKVFAILTNLIKNAIKFTNKGHVEFGYVKKDKFLEFYVKDSGVGIQEEKQNVIFERFRQGSEEYSRGYEGAGLGLSISKAYVELLGGKIWVKSDFGIGSTFYFTIPFITEQIEIKGIKNIVKEIKEKNQIINLKILIVEDDVTTEMLIKNIVEKYGKEILIARNGVEAILLCRNNPDLDLILMDIKMPEMNGYEATKQIRQFNKDVIIFAQTAYALSSDRDKAIEAGCNDYISKPYGKDLFAELMEKTFNK